MKRLISFEIKSDFGFLKKPDTNEPVCITYNMLHKPALLGILGAIIGLSGFKIVLETGRKKKREYVPEFIEQLGELPIGIQPLNSENGNYSKMIIRYNNSAGYASEEQGGNLLINEQTLIAPSYRCFLLLDIGKELEKIIYQNLKNKEAEYLPYLGKNDFPIWWDGFTDNYEVNKFQFNHDYNICSLIKKTDPLVSGIAEAFGRGGRDQTKNLFMYFERLPVGYRNDLMQYVFADFAYSNATLKKEYRLDNLYQINGSECIQLF